MLLTGSFCEQPPIGLIRTLERSGCYIVDDDFVQIHRWIKSDIPTDGDPLDALVMAFLTDAVASPTRYIDRGEKGAELLERVRESGAEGVLFCAPSFCDPALLDQPMAVRAVERAQGAVDRVQVLGEHRPVPGHSRAGRHVRRFDQVVERSMSDHEVPRVKKDASQVRRRR